VSGRYYRYTSAVLREEVSKEAAFCGQCGRHADDMKEKPPIRHRPGGNLIEFIADGDNIENMKVAVKSFPATTPNCLPRCGVIGDELGYLSGDLEVEENKDGSTIDADDSLIFFVSNKFKRHAYMEFPIKVQYVTFGD
jgi:hypothetical protein